MKTMKKMKTVVTMFTVSALTISLVGCMSADGTSTGINKQDVGMVTGGVLGGVLGNSIGGGNGRVIATIGGTILGAFLGGAVGKSMDDTDRMKMNQALETAPTGQTSTWSNPDNGRNYAVTPTQTYTNSSGQPCRKASVRTVIDGQAQTAYTTACRAPNGTWQLSS